MNTFAPNMVDLASEGDRAWFAVHRDRTIRIRPFIVGEFPQEMPKGDGVAITIVRQVRLGVRLRVPAYVAKLPIDNEAEASAAWVKAMGRAA